MANLALIQWFIFQSCCHNRKAVIGHFYLRDQGCHLVLPNSNLQIIFFFLLSTKSKLVYCVLVNESTYFLNGDERIGSLFSLGSGEAYTRVVTPKGNYTIRGNISHTINYRIQFPAWGHGFHFKLGHWQFWHYCMTAIQRILYTKL